MLNFNEYYNTYDFDSYVIHMEDPSEPDLFEDIFPYSEPPKLGFNHRLVPMRTPKDIWITDTTFRDGQQAMAPFTLNQVVDIYKFLYELGGKSGVIRQTEFFLYTDRDRKIVEKLLEFGYQYPEVTGWIRADKEDLKLVKKMGLKETGILTSVSDYHIFLKMKKTRRKIADEYKKIVEEAIELGIIPRCHFEDITRADFYGFVVPFAYELMEIARESKTPIKIRACDTLGLGVPFPGVAMPRSVAGLIYGLVHQAGVPSEWLEWHGHNDFGLVTANSVTAWLYGCSAVNATMLGRGERTGNAPLEIMVITYLQLRGNINDVNTTVITEIAEYFKKHLGCQIANDQPLVGEDFNMTRAGIHADGLIKDERIYNIFDTAKLLNRPVSVALTDKSGRAGILLWLHNKIGRGAPLSKDDPGISKILEWIQKQYDKGRTTPISDKEMIKLVKKHLKHWLEASNFRI